MFRKMLVVLFSTFILLALTACADEADEMKDGIDGVDDTEAIAEKDTRPKEVDEPLDGLEVHFINTGLSDDILIRTAETTIVMGANRESFVGMMTESPIPYLKSQLVDEIDLLISTSGESKDFSHIADILETIPVKELWSPKYQNNDNETGIHDRVQAALQQQDITPYTPLAGGTSTIGDIDLEVIHSPDPNSDSFSDTIAIKITYGDMSYLFTGHMTSYGEKDLLKSDVDLQSTVLKTSSDSRIGSSPDFITAVDPSVAIILSGEHSLHPEPPLIDMLDERGIAEYGTVGHGTIVISTDGKSYHIETETEPTSVDPYNRPERYKPRSLKSIKQ